MKFKAKSIINKKTQRQLYVVAFTLLTDIYVQYQLLHIILRNDKVCRKIKTLAFLPLM